jgi:competence protein ComEC
MSKSKPGLKSESGFFIFAGVFAIALLLSLESLPALGFALILLRYLWRNHRALIVPALVFVSLWVIRGEMIASRWNTKPTTVSGTVIGIEENHIVVSTINGKWLVFGLDDMGYDIGMAVTLRGERREVDRFEIAGGFDYVLYLQSQGYAGVFAAEASIVTGRRFTFFAWRAAVIDYLDRTYSPTSAAMIRYVFLGSDDALDPEWVEAIRTIGIAHLFAISGMHLTLILTFARSLWRNLFWREDRFILFQIGFLILYNILTGFSISLLRASALALILPSRFATTRFSKLDLLTLVMGVFLVVNPMLIYHLGFQLSFLISAALCLVPPREKSEPAIKNALRLSTMAALISLPIVAGIQSQISIFQIPVNVVFTAAVAYGLLPITFLTLVISPFDALYAKMVGMFQAAVTWVEAGSIFLRIHLHGIWTGMYWLVLFAFLQSWLGRKKCWKSGLALVLIVLMASMSYRFDPTTNVTVLDVNQGDAIHIEGPRCQMLIDTGDVDKHDGLLGYLLRKGITKLDVLVITHNHSDHYGELSDLSQAIEIRKVIAGSQPPVAYRSLLQIAKKGDFITCGEIVLEVLSSDIGHANPNNNSIVLYGLIGTDRWLFMADAEVMVETAMMTSWNGNVDRLKVGHHGSLTSTSQAFLDAVKPIDAIISVGLHNRFLHPSEVVLDRLDHAGVFIWRTDLQGSIRYRYLWPMEICIVETVDFDRRKWFERDRIPRICR